MKIDLSVLNIQYKLHQQEYEAAALRVLCSGWYVLGPEVEAFENEFAAYVGCKYCVGVNSGLDALTLSINALGIGAGDEVLVPANTYIATVLAITKNGAKPVFVEPDVYYGIDADRIEAAITKKTKAIITYIPKFLSSLKANIIPLIAYLILSKIVLFFINFPHK